MLELSDSQHEEHAVWLEKLERREELERGKELEQMQVLERIEEQQQRKVLQRREEQQHVQQLKLLERLERFTQLERLGQPGQLEEIKKFQQFLFSEYLQDSRANSELNKLLQVYKLLELDQLFPGLDMFSERQLFELRKALQLDKRLPKLVMLSEWEELLELVKLLEQKEHFFHCHMELDKLAPT